VVIGGAAGALAAVRRILSHPAGPARPPVVLVLHRKEGFAADYASILPRQGGINLKEADEKEALARGTVYIAPAGYHLLIENDRTFGLSVDARVHWARPSIDVLFESAADAFGPSLIGIILTGANDDGAAGLQAVEAAGGLAIVQDPKSAEFNTMPEAARRAARHPIILELDEIGALLASLAAMPPMGLRP
jgi:two-component system chemotaxis response regulator CheB